MHDVERHRRVKIEVDTNPPAGAVLTTTVIRRHVMLHLQHHDRASLLASKLHAILQWPYLKGRDVYDGIGFGFVRLSGRGRGSLANEAGEE